MGTFLGKVIRKVLSAFPQPGRKLTELSPYKSYLVFSPPKSLNGVLLTFIYATPTQGIKIYHQDHFYYFRKGTFIKLPTRDSIGKFKRSSYTYKEVEVDETALEREVGSKWSLLHNCYSVAMAVSKPLDNK
ncbi:hypothetical protein GR7B_00157 [Vibrio phage vB_VcorM_GR7B]|nr:hypothetical protein GR7B_00157 [Vibrio phage vB_VcorM_GR7B]